MADLILQAIVRPTDAPAEIRAAVADALTRRDGATYTWEDVGIAASAVVVGEETGALETQWAFALSAEQPKLGEQLRSTGAWSIDVTGLTHWRALLFDAVTTEPRTQ